MISLLCAIGIVVGAPVTAWMFLVVIVLDASTIAITYMFVNE